MNRLLSQSGLAVLAIAAVLLATPAQAQELRGRVQGVVTDVSGAVIPAASVTLHNINTNASAVQETDEVGRYFFGSVLPGTYQIRIELDGFRTYLQENILVQTRADITVNAAMEVGCAVIANLDEHSPAGLAHMKNVIDINSCDRLPDIEAATQIGVAARDIAHSRYGWDTLVAQLRQVVQA